MTIDADLKTTIVHLPLQQRIQLLSFIEQNIVEEQARLAESSLRLDLDKVVERLDRSDDLQSVSISFSDMFQFAIEGQ